MNLSQSFANIIMDMEQSKFPYFTITEVEIIESNDNYTKYRCKVTSKLDSKWSLWSGTSEVDSSKLVSEYRDEKINLLLKD